MRRLWNGSTLTITAAGPITVQASQTGNGTYSAAAPVSVIIVVNKAELAVVASNQVLAFGAALPALTGTITGAIVGDGNTASYLTTAVAGSPVGTYPIARR